MLGIFLSGLFDNIVKFTLPAIAVILIAVSGVADLGDFAVIAIIAIGVLVGGAALVTGIIRSEAFTRRLAEVGERVANWGLEKIKRDPVEGLSERVVGFRDLAIDIVKERGAIALFYSAIGKLWAFAILWMSLRIVGIEPDVLSGLAIFVVLVVVLLITAIPITPGGIGIAEIAYIGLFTAVAGEQYSDIIAAGVILFRLVQFALPIPIGWTVVYFWRRQINRGDLPNPYTLPASTLPDEAETP